MDRSVAFRHLRRASGRRASSFREDRKCDKKPLPGWSVRSPSRRRCRPTHEGGLAMIRTRIGLAALPAVIVLAAGAAMAQTTSAGGGTTATASLEDASGNDVGEVRLTQYNSGVVLHGELTG